MTPLDGLQQALAAEHAAVFVHGALGARTSASATPGLYTQLVAGYDVHRDRRDELVERIRAHGGEPVASEPAYELPDELGSADAVSRSALELEQRCMDTYGWLVEQTSGNDRRFAVAALTDAAVRALAYRGSPEIFPGMARARTVRR